MKFSQRPTAPKPMSLLIKRNFDNAIWTIGTNIIIENYLQCPCKRKGGESLVSCMNCLGSGSLFIDPRQTKALSHGDRKDSFIRSFGELADTVLKFTVTNEDRVTEKDRITMIDLVDTHVETIQIEDGFDEFFLTFPPTEIHYLKRFVDIDEKVIDYPIEDVEIEGVKIKFKNLRGNAKFSIRYDYNPQYIVVKGFRNSMSHPEYTSSSSLDVDIKSFPTHFYAQKANFCNDYSKYGEGEDYIAQDNSFL